MTQPSVNRIDISQCNASRRLAHVKGICNICRFVIVSSRNISSDPNRSSCIQGDDITGSRGDTGHKKDDRTITGHRNVQCDWICTVNNIRKIGQLKGGCRLGNGQRTRFASLIVGIINGRGDIIGSLGRWASNQRSVSIPVNNGNSQPFNRRRGCNTQRRPGVPLSGVG